MLFSFSFFLLLYISTSIWILSHPKRWSKHAFFLVIFHVLVVSIDLIAAQKSFFSLHTKVYVALFALLRIC